MSPRRDTAVVHHDLRGFGSGSAVTSSSGSGGRTGGSLADEIDALLDDEEWEDVRSGKAGRRAGSAGRGSAGSGLPSATATRAPPVGTHAGASTSASRANVSGSSKLDAESFLASFGDLNRVGDASLRAAKAKMDVVFDANRLKPGDEGYVYDLRVDFQPPTETSEWDE